MITTYHYRIKDAGSTAKKLNKMAHSVNLIWNFCKQTQTSALKNKTVKRIYDPKTGQTYFSPYFFTKFEMNDLVSGSSKELGLHSQSVQAVAEEYITRRKQFKKTLRWRSEKTLGWVPFKAIGIKLYNGKIKYNKEMFSFWNSRNLPKDAKIKSGSFAQDNRGHWYLNITFETNHINYKNENLKENALFLSNHTLVSFHDGRIIKKPKFSLKLEKKISKINKKKKILLMKNKRIKNLKKTLGKSKIEKRLAAKLENIKQDFLHKESTKVVNSSALIITNKLPNYTKKFDKKNIYLSTRFNIKNFQKMLSYKALRAGRAYTVVPEKNLVLAPFKCCCKQSRIDIRKRAYVCRKCGKRSLFTTHASINLYFASKHLFRIGHDTP